MADESLALRWRPSGPADEVARLRREADVLRLGIGRDVDELRSRVRAAFDLRRQVSRHPLVAAAVVLGAAFVAAGLAKALIRGARRRAADAPRQVPGCRVTGSHARGGSRTRSVRIFPKEAPG